MHSDKLCVVMYSDKLYVASDKLMSSCQIMCRRDKLLSSS